MTLDPLLSRPHPIDPSAALKPSKNATEASRLRHATQQFEAVFLRQMLTDAQKPMLAKPLLGKGFGADMVRDMSVERMAEQMSRAGGIGVARSIESSLQKTISKPGPVKLGSHL